MQNASGILLKGSGTDLRLTVAEDLNDAGLASEADRLLEEASSILRGSTAVIDLQGRTLNQPFFSALLESLIWPLGMTVASWVTIDVETQRMLRGLGAKLGEPAPVVREPRSCLPLVVERSLRSGQRIEHEGDVVVVGHVNDGSEIFASGNVSIWGRLQGLVHAGFDGNDDVKVLVRQFEARQIRVGRCFGTMEKNVAWWGQSAMIAVEDGKLQVRNIDL